MASSNNHKKQRSIAEKLHKQFAHPTPSKLLKLVKKSGFHNKTLEDEILRISEQCLTCLKYKKAPPRPVVSLPMATRFNEVISMDLKVFEDNFFLVMVDMATRFCSAAVIKNKNPSTVIKKIFTNWITIFGQPKKILSDNGCEFNNSIMRELGDKFGIKILTTAAESPWSNGICERLNGVLSNLVNKILHESHCDLEIALSWAVSARNSLDNNSGYSPNQLVFGYNPNIPDVFHSELPGLEDASKEELIRKNLNAMHIARQEFIKFESDERIRRALRHNVRQTNVDNLHQGDDVYYKRNANDQWQGPATVIGKDNKQVIIKHGGYPLRVHIVRLAKHPSDDVSIPNEMDTNVSISTTEPVDEVTFRPKPGSGDIDKERTLSSNPLDHDNMDEVRSRDNNKALDTYNHHSSHKKLGNKQLRAARPQGPNRLQVPNGITEPHSSTGKSGDIVDHGFNGERSGADGCGDGVDHPHSTQISGFKVICDDKVDHTDGTWPDTDGCGDIVDHPHSIQTSRPRNGTDGRGDAVDHPHSTQLSKTKDMQRSVDRLIQTLMSGE